jgi:amino acid transporter
MSQEATAQADSNAAQGDERNHGGNLLGPILCWAVVFADIGTSVYYVPGILYGNVGKLAGFFVLLTMSVFVLLTLKYAEVTHRFPQGGGVVTVAARAINHWVGALGGMLILVDYFLTATISCLSGVLYLSVVVPTIGPYATPITAVVLLLLGVLNWVGISESARVSLVGAVIAFLSDLAILFTVFSHITFATFLSLFPAMFANNHRAPLFLLVGFAGSFLAFSGLESISQLSPVMKTPRKKVAGIALLIVVLTIGITSPLLTMFSTLLQPQQAVNPQQNAQLISLLAGHWGNIFLQTEVAISASALLVFASNTAIIGSYHVFMALSRMDFFPTFILKRNKLRGTPHYSIALATGIPVLVLIIANGNLDQLGNLYAFGLLGAFTLTCLGLDLVRHRERKAARAQRYISPHARMANSQLMPARENDAAAATLNGNARGAESARRQAQESGQLKITTWSTIDFYLGILTTFLVAVAWTTNLIYKRDATLFGGIVASVGMTIAFFNYRYHKSRGRTPVTITGVEGRLPGSVLAVLMPGNGNNDAVIRTAIGHADGHPVVFLYVSDKKQPERTPSMFEVVEPYLDDMQAKEAFSKAENLAEKARVPRRYVYRQKEPGSVSQVWQAVHPHDTVVAAKSADKLDDINPDRIRYELTSQGKVAHMLKQW